MKNQKSVKKPKKKLELIRFAEYMVGGGAWFWSGYVLIILLDNHIGLFLANLVGNAVGITLNFLLQRYWAFKAARPANLAVATQRYIIYTALNAFLLNYLILKFLDNNGIGVEIGQFIAAGFFTFWNYLWYKIYVFKGMEHSRKARQHA